MRITVDGVAVDCTNLELRVDTMPGAMLVLSVTSQTPTVLLVVTPPPTQNAESPDSNPVVVLWPSHNTPGGAQISGGVEPYIVTYTPTRGSSFAVGTTQVTIDVTSEDDQVAQMFFDVVVEDPPAPPPPNNLDVTGPSGVTAFTPDGSPVAVTFQALATGGLQPYIFTYWEGGTQRFSGNNYALGTRTLTVHASDSQAPPDTDNTHSFPLTVYQVGAAHDYFNALVAHASHYRSWPLRSQTNINSVTGGGNGTNTYFTYNLAGDPYPDKQDAMKFYKVPGTATGLADSIPGNQQLRMPIGIRFDSGDTVLTIWDWWYGEEFRTNHGSVANYKIFNIRSSDGATNSGGICFGTKIGFVDATAAGDVGGHYNSLVSNASPPTGMQQPDTVIPTGVGAIQQHVQSARHMLRWGIWTRHIMEVRTNVLGSNAVFNDWKSLNSGLDYSTFNTTLWNVVSQWAIDENRDSVRLLYRVPFRTLRSHIAHLNFEFNTSANIPAQTGPFIGYGRNAIVLRNYATNVSEGDSNIFQRPV